MSRTVWDTFRERVIFGFHGNTRTSIEAARQRGFLREGKDGDWLGGGFYFWLDAPERAWEWAEAMVERQAREQPELARDDPRVVVARLQPSDLWIDLIEKTPWFTRFREAAVLLLNAGRLPDQRDPLRLTTLAAAVLHRRDYALIEMAMDRAAFEGIEVDAIRCAFIEGAPVVDHSALFDKAHVQIVVRNPIAILAYQVLEEKA